MRRGGSTSGAVSMALIFCTLCLAVFTVLTVSAAERERRLTELTAERAAAYYAADRQAVEIVAALRRGEPVDTAEISYTMEDGLTLAEFSLPAGGEQLLEVCVRLDGDEAEILRWRTAYGGEWEPDETIELWDGGIELLEIID